MRKIIILSFGIIISGFLFYSSAFADNVDYTVNVAPSLNVSVSSNNVVLDLNPNTKTSDSKDITVTVGTNNITGYKLNMSTTGDITSLTRDSSVDGKTASIPTLGNADATGTTAADLTDNRWGYRLNNTGNFIPYVSGVQIMEKNIATNADTATLSFASKINYSQAAGSYNINLNFVGTVNPLMTYIQDFTASECQEKASDADYTVVDKRDNNEYTVRYINGNCWMTQNLRYIGDTGSTSGSMIMKATTSNISADTTIGYTDLTAGNSYDEARLHVATPDQVPTGATFTAKDMGVWYNYAAASAMTITGSSNPNAQVYDICPKGWRLPTSGDNNSEQSGITSYASAYNPIVGGCYNGGTLDNDGRQNHWWSSTVGYFATTRYWLTWTTFSQLYTQYYYRNAGVYVRCIRSS